MTEYHDNPSQRGATRRTWMFENAAGVKIGHAGPFADFDLGLAYAEAVLGVIGNAPVVIRVCDMNSAFPDDARVSVTSPAIGNMAEAKQWMKRANELPAWGGGGR